MSEMNVSVNDVPSGGITVRCEQDLGYLVDEYAKRIQRRVDAAALDRAAGTLAEFGYVKVVRCRDCDNAAHFYQWLTPSKRSSIETWTCRNMEGFEIDPDGFCAWGERRGDAE